MAKSKLRVAIEKKLQGRPKPQSPTAGLVKRRYGCGGKIKTKKTS